MLPSHQLINAISFHKITSLKKKTNSKVALSPPCSTPWGKSHATRETVEDWAPKVYFLPRLHCTFGGIRNGGRLHQIRVSSGKIRRLHLPSLRQKPPFKLYGTEFDWYLNVISSLFPLIPGLFGSIFQLGVTVAALYSIMWSSNPEATDSSNTRPPMSPAESSINSVFKMTKGCVMLKVKRHVSMHIYLHTCLYLQIVCTTWKLNFICKKVQHNIQYKRLMLWKITPWCIPCEALAKNNSQGFKEIHSKELLCSLQHAPNGVTKFTLHKCKSNFAWTVFKGHSWGRLWAFNIQ